ncbi:armadillo-type protein [Mycena galopus ATCC 62051]|nr:armadillo-type protein [Mycena galopus ATCC 62051]
MSSPLARQESRPSIYSWWSDSNPGLKGPTINLHAAAKPLSRFLYHRQALDIIRKNCGSPLSAATLETYSSYFPWNYVSWSTKAAILSDLADRSTSEAEARAVVDSPVFPHVAQMLGSPNAGVRISSCRLLQSLLSQASIAPAVLELKPCEQLLSILRDKRPGVIREAGSVLYEISKSVHGAQAIVNAKATDISVLLESPNPVTLQWTCSLVGRLASHDSVASATVNFIAQIVSLLGNEDSSIIQRAGFALFEIARSEDRAQAIANAKATDISMLFKSPHPETLRQTCALVGRLASHDSVAPATVNFIVQIVSLLGNNNSGIIQQAGVALFEIARSEDRAQAIVNAKATDISMLLKSPIPETLQWTCNLVGRLASHDSVAPATVNFIVQIVSLLGNNDSGIIQQAGVALFEIARSEDRAQAIANAMATDISMLLKSPHPETLRQTCALVGRLASHDSVAPATVNFIVQIVSLLGNNNSGIIQQAGVALFEIARSEDRAQAIANAKATDISMLLKSPHPETLQQTCALVGRLASHDSVAPATVNFIVQIVSLLGNNDSGIIQQAGVALFEIARSEDRAQAIANARAADISVLLESPNPETLRQTCALVGRLARHDSVAPATMNFIVQIVSLLGNKDSSIIQQAGVALFEIARSEDRAQAIANAKATDIFISMLLKSPHPETLRQTCALVGRLASHDSVAPATVNFIVQIVSLLGNKDSAVIAEAGCTLSRIAQSEDGAQAIANVKDIDISVLLKSRNTETVQQTWNLVKRLASHNSVMPAILKLVMSLLSNKDHVVVALAGAILFEIAQVEDAAQAIVNAKATDISVLLKSLNPETLQQTCNLVKRLASHNSVMPAILKFVVQIMSLLSNTNSAIISRAGDTLFQIARSEDGAQAIVNANAKDYILVLLNSPSTKVWESTCRLVGILSSYESTAPAILDIESCTQIVSLLHNKNPWAIQCAVYALSKIAQSEDGARAIVNAKATRYIPILLESPHPYSQRRTCDLVGRLARHDCVSPEILKLIVQIVFLLRNKNDLVIGWALCALSKIAQSEGGSQAIVDAKATDYILPLLESPNLKVRQLTCELVGGLAIHESTALAISELRPYVQLASLLPDHVLALLRPRDPPPYEVVSELSHSWT